MIEVTVDRRRWWRGGTGPDGALSYSRLLSDTGSQRVHGAAGHVYHDVASDVRDDRPGLDSCVRALRTDGAPAREDWDL